MPMTLPKRAWTDMTWEEIAGAGEAARRWIAVLPLAAVEQHGPHLPLGVDSFIAEAYLSRVFEVLPGDLPATFLPLQRIGVSVEHVEYAGTLSLSAATAVAAWTEIGESLARAVRHARRHRRLASLRLSAGNVFQRRSKTRHSRRRHRNVTHACCPAGYRAYEQGGARRASESRHGARIQVAEREPPGWICLDDAGFARDRRAGRRHARDRRQG